MKTNILKALFLSAIVLLAARAEAQTCNFTRDLYQGTWGEDVRCLQQYLSTATGYSAPGYGYSGLPSQTYIIPDGFFGPLTAQALMQWQATKGIPASGYFDAASRAKYFELTGGAGGFYGGNYYGNSFGVAPEEQPIKSGRRSE